jgi:hypothetical protein
VRVFIINTDYDRFTAALDARNPSLAEANYAEQLAARDATLFGVSDFYPRRLRELGHEATEVHINNERLQRAWARERGLAVASGSVWQPVARIAGVSIPVPRAPAWLPAILRAQIEDFRPDVVLTHELQEPEIGFWRWIKARGAMLVGQIASPLPRSMNSRDFDLLLSSLPNFVERFRAAGARAELFRLGFDPIVLERLGPRPEPEHTVSFVGSVSPAHAERIAWLEAICAATDVAIYAHGADRLPKDSPIRQRNRGEVWGIDMYRVLAASRITLNRHIGIAGQSANNMRLYEATGVGTLLITDSKANLPEMFEPGREVVAYKSTDECISQIRRLTATPADAEAIRQAGAQRTLACHTYSQRMKQLVDLVHRAA